MPQAIEIPKFIEATDDLFVYGQAGGVAQQGATTMAMIQEFMRNNSDVLKCLVQSLWQPQVQYAANQIVWSPNMAPNLCAQVKTAGTTLGTEPVWNTVVGAEVSDGTVVYTMCETVPNIATVVRSVNGVAADNEGEVSLRNALYCHDASEFMEELGTAGWNSKGVYAVTFSNTQNFPQKPSNSYFALFNLAETSNNGYAIQMLLNIINGDLYTRGTNNQAELDEVPFKRLAFYSEVLAALPVGTILPFAGSSIPTGFLACNGAGVRATTYANLYAVIGNTYGGNSTTFNLPQIEDNRFLEFSSARGTKHNAGLPNITGSYPRCPHEENLYQAPTGAFGMAGPSPEIPGTSSESSNTRGLSFDASRSNSIYGGSTTVQPKSLTVRAIIKY